MNTGIHVLGMREQSHRPRKARLTRLTPDSMSALASQLTRRPDHLRLVPSHGRQGTWQCPKKVLLTSRGRFNVKWLQSKGQDSETIKPHVQSPNMKISSSVVLICGHVEMKHLW